MRIDKKLNMVIPLYNERKPGEKEDDMMPIAYVHSAPISAEVFDAYFLVIAKTFSAMMTEGLGLVGGPKIADKLLRSTAQELGVWNDAKDGTAGVQNGLLAHIYRLTNVACPGDRGWTSIPYEQAKKSHLSIDDASEVESAICFFTLASLMLRKNQVEAVVGGALKLWGAQLTSLAYSEYQATLPVSSPIASIGARVAV